VTLGEAKLLSVGGGEALLSAAAALGTCALDMQLAGARGGLDVGAV
jgi:hypothetical protein